MNITNTSGEWKPFFQILSRENGISQKPAMRLINNDGGDKGNRASDDDDGGDGKNDCH